MRLTAQKVLAGQSLCPMLQVSGGFVGGSGSVGCGVGVGVGDGVGPGVGDGVGNTTVAIGPGVGLGVGLGVGDGVGSGLGLGVGPGVGLGLGAGVGDTPSTTVNVYVTVQRRSPLSLLRLNSSATIVWVPVVAVHGVYRRFRFRPSSERREKGEEFSVVVMVALSR